MSDVPDEILREILSRLPVAPLLRFRCVSKSWKSLIENQQFIKHHLNHAQKTDSSLNIVLRCRQHLYSCDIDLLNQTNVATFKELSHPLETTYGGTQILGYGGTQILGSCDGLLVLRNHKDDVTIFWNPSVRRFHEIPFCGIDFPGNDMELYFGFGYDVVSDDYKLIRIDEFAEDVFNSEVKVYSLKSDSWRRIHDFPYHIRTGGTNGVLANGSLHWIVTGKVKLVAVFDLGTEEFRLMALPKFAGDYDDMIVLGGCLSLMCYVNDEHVDIWVMKEYGVQESWSILFRFDMCDAEFMRPLAYPKCGRKVLLRLDLDDEDVLKWYDLDTKSTDLPTVQMPSENMSTDDDMYTCLQSLVLLNGGTCDFDLVTKKKEERNDCWPRPRKEYYQLLVVPKDIHD